MDAVARGRVWTGAQALSLGLVDRLGGLDDAHRLAAELAGLPAKRLPPLVEYPKSQSLVEKLGAALSEDKSDGLSAAPSAGGGWAAAVADWAAGGSGLAEVARAWDLVARAGAAARRAEEAGGVSMRMEEGDAGRWA